MRIVLQRVSEASVTIDTIVTGAIGPGLLLLLGIHHDDTPAHVVHLAAKCADLRIFSDENGKMNRSVKDIGGSVLLVSQFTLYGDARKGTRPGFTDAAPPTIAIPLYELFITEMKKLIPNVQCGTFGADMQVSLINDGPVTIILDK